MAGRIAIKRFLFWISIAGAPLAFPAGAQALEQKLLASDGSAGDSLGRSVAIDGDTAVVGASSDDGFRGAVYVFTRTRDSWSQSAKLTASDGAANDFLGSSVGIDGDTIIAGAFFDNISGNASQGSVYTFARTGAAARTETAKLTASDGAANDQLGLSVGIDGDTIIAGAYGDNVGGAFQGSVYTFARTGAAARTETAKLTASDGATNEYLGWSVGIDGDTIIASAYGDTVGGNASQGSVYTFARTGAAARIETAKLTASDGAAGDRLGYSVGIDGDTIVAGADGDNIGANNEQGSAYTFARAGAPARTETAKLTASDGALGDYLGEAVAIDGDTIAVAGRLDDIGTSIDEGSAYTFTTTGLPARTETANLSASDGAAGDNFGRSVAVDGDTILAGANSDDVGVNSGQGSASIFFPAVSPDTEITKAPKRKVKTSSSKKQVTFEFIGTDDSTPPASLTFECKLDSKPFKPCSTPRLFKARKGKHKFQVRAIDGADNTDPTPAKKSFKVVKKR